MGGGVGRGLALRGEGGELVVGDLGLMEGGIGSGGRVRDLWWMLGITYLCGVVWSVLICASWGGGG